MAVEVVVDFEVVDVDENNLERDVLTPRLPPDAPDVFVEDTAVVKPREAVALRELVQEPRLEEVGAQRVLEVVGRDPADHGRGAEHRCHVVELVQRQAEKNAHHEVREHEHRGNGDRDVEQQSEKQARVRITSTSPAST